MEEPIEEDHNDYVSVYYTRTRKNIVMKDNTMVVLYFRLALLTPFFSNTSSEIDGISCLVLHCS